jgi:hypothetical protein
VGVGGCVAIGQDFKQLAAERMHPNDDVDAVYAKLHDIVDELRRVDRLGEPYEVAGTHALRGSVERNLTLQVVGFRRDGTVVLIQFGNFTEFDGAHLNARARFQDFDGEPEHAHFTCGVPNGVPIDDVLGYYVILEPMPLSRAMRHVLSLQHQLHTDHPSRVTSDCNATILAWDGDGRTPVVETLTLDVTAAEIEPLIREYVEGQRALGAAVVADMRENP